MKRLITIVLALVVLFSFVGCEDFSALSLFLDGMNGNILGTSTENSDIAKDAVDNVINKQEEVKVPETPEVKVDEKLTDELDKAIEDAKKENPDATTGSVKVEVTDEKAKEKIEAESTKVGGIVITEEKKAAADAKAQELAEKHGGEKVDTNKVLEPIKQEEKTDLLNKIAATKDNQKAKEDFIAEMKKPAPAETQEATKGTVVVVSSAIDDVLKQIDKAPETPPAPDAQPTVQQQAAAALKETQKALETFIAPTDADGNKVELTKADATIVKLAESFLTTTVQAVTETTYSVEVTKDSATQEVSQKVTSEVKPKAEITEEAKQQIANEAAQLVTAMNTMSSASKIDTTALNDLIKNLAGAMPQGGEPAARALRAAETIEGIPLPGVEIPDDEQADMIKGMIRDVHSILVNVFEGQAPSSVVSHFRLHRMGYESYVANSDVAAIAANEDFNTIDSFLKYVVTSVIVEADNIKGILLAEDGGAYIHQDLISDLHLNMDYVGKLSVYDLLHQVFLATPAFHEGNTTDNTINLPVKWFKEGELPTIDQELAQRLSDLLMDIFKNQSNVMSILNTAEKVAEPVLEEGLAKQILPFIQDAKDYLTGAAK